MNATCWRHTRQNRTTNWKMRIWKSNRNWEYSVSILKSPRICCYMLTVMWYMRGRYGKVIKKQRNQGRKSISFFCCSLKVVCVKSSCQRNKRHILGVIFSIWCDGWRIDNKMSILSTKCKSCRNTRKMKLYGSRWKNALMQNVNNMVKHQTSATMETVSAVLL